MITDLSINQLTINTVDCIILKVFPWSTTWVTTWLITADRSPSTGANLCFFTSMKTSLLISQLIWWVVTADQNDISCSWTKRYWIWKHTLSHPLWKQPRRERGKRGDVMITTSHDAQQLADSAGGDTEYREPNCGRWMSRNDPNWTQMCSPAVAAFHQTSLAMMFYNYPSLYSILFFNIRLLVPGRTGLMSTLWTPSANPTHLFLEKIKMWNNGIWFLKEPALLHFELQPNLKKRYIDPDKETTFSENALL